MNAIAQSRVVPQPGLSRSTKFNVFTFSHPAVIRVSLLYRSAKQPRAAPLATIHMETAEREREVGRYEILRQESENIMNAPHEPEDMVTKLRRVFNPCNVGGWVTVAICAYFAWKTGNWQDFAAISAIAGLVAGAGSYVVEMFVKNRASFSRVPVAVAKMLMGSEDRLQKQIEETEDRLQKQIEETEDRLQKQIEETEVHLQKQIEESKIELLNAIRESSKNL